MRICNVFVSAIVKGKSRSDWKYKILPPRACLKYRFISKKFDFLNVDDYVEFYISFQTNVPQRGRNLLSGSSYSVFPGCSSLLITNSISKSVNEPSSKTMLVENDMILIPLTLFSGSILARPSRAASGLESENH